VWHPAGETGRYGFVIGDKERPGGDVAFMSKLRAYWTPFDPTAQTLDDGARGSENEQKRCFWFLCFR